MAAIFQARSENLISQSRNALHRNPNPNPIRFPRYYNTNHSNPQRRSSPAAMNRRYNTRAKVSPESGPIFPAKNLVMGQVKILKRGEQLPTSSSDSTSSSSESRESSPDESSCGCSNAEDMLVLCSTQRLGPDPETVQKQITLLDLSAFVVLPLPSSLPLPKFFGTKVKNGCVDSE